MKRILFLLAILGISLAIIASEETQICNTNYVLIELEFNQGVFTLKDKSIETGCFSQIPSDPNWEYTYNLKKGGENLYSSSFNPELVYLDTEQSGELTGEVIELQSGKLYLASPNVEESDSLEIYKEGQKIFETTIFDAGAKNCRIK